MDDTKNGEGIASAAAGSDIGNTGGSVPQADGDSGSVNETPASEPTGEDHKD